MIFLSFTLGCNSLLAPCATLPSEYRSAPNRYALLMRHALATTISRIVAGTKALLHRHPSPFPPYGRSDETVQSWQCKGECKATPAHPDHPALHTFERSQDPVNAQDWSYRSTSGISGGKSQGKHPGGRPGSFWDGQTAAHPRGRIALKKRGQDGGSPSGEAIIGGSGWPSPKLRVGEFTRPVPVWGLGNFPNNLHTSGGNTWIFVQ